MTDPYADVAAENRRAAESASEDYSDLLDHLGRVLQPGGVAANDPLVRDPLVIAFNAARAYLACCEKLLEDPAEDPDLDRENVAEVGTSSLHAVQAFSTLAVAEAMEKIARRGLGRA